MKSTYLFGFGIGIAIPAMIFQQITGAIIVAGCFIAAGMYRIAEAMQNRGG